MVIWIIGLSGAGKSALGNALVEQIRSLNNKVVFLDGDLIRELFKNDVDHSTEGRRINAERISKLSNFLSNQEVHVVAAVLSIFPEWQVWNRENIKDYYEIYLKASIESLIARDSKGLYRRALKGEINNVVGIDIPFPEPKNPDLLIENESFDKNLYELVNIVMNQPIFERLKIKE